MPLSDRDHFLRAVTEDHLLADVQAEALRTGWRFHHIRNSKAGVTQGDPGFPDVVMVRKSRLIFAELKRETGSLSPEQAEWGTQLGNLRGVEYYIWRPRHWDEIREILKW